MAGQYGTAITAASVTNSINSDYYTFGGWWTGEKGQGKRVSTYGDVPNETKIYAYWIPTRMTIGFWMNFTTDPSKTIGSQTWKDTNGSEVNESLGYISTNGSYTIEFSDNGRTMKLTPSSSTYYCNAGTTEDVVRWLYGHWNEALAFNVLKSGSASISMSDIVASGRWNHDGTNGCAKIAFYPGK